MAYIKYYTQDRIGTIVLDRPEKRNALNAQVVSELLEVLNLAEKDSDCKVIILKASGDVFCAGADLGYLQELQNNSFDENLADSRHLKSLFERLYNFPKVIIAHVHGHAIAGGAGLATVCDLVYTAPDVQFGYTEVRIGFIPAIVSFFLLRKIGESKSKDLLLTGRLISANEALDMGMVNAIFPKDQLAKEVDAIAHKLVSRTSGQSLAATKKLIARVQELPETDALELAAHENAKGRESTDCKRGIEAFLNKEKIVW